MAADLVQGEETRLTVLSTFGTLADGEVATTAEEIDLPPVEECVAIPQSMRDLIPMTNRFDMRFHPDHAALRRYLVDEGFLTRDAGFYWRSGGTVAI